jgi:hypothetical protein
MTIAPAMITARDIDPADRNELVDPPPGDTDQAIATLTCRYPTPETESRPLATPSFGYPFRVEPGLRHANQKIMAQGCDLDLPLVGERPSAHSWRGPVPTDRHTWWNPFTTSEDLEVVVVLVRRARHRRV